jgi:hypothetical protein
MTARYTSTRLTFKRDVIEPLSDDDRFEIETPEGVFGLTKSEFHRAFSGVVDSESYRDRGLYCYARTPVRARKFLTAATSTEANPNSQVACPVLSGEEPLHKDASPLDRTVGDFWRWSNSDLLSNALRGCLAEYLVAIALGVDDKPRREWAAWDLTSPDGIRVEVKSSAYVQSWFQRRPSIIQFGVGETAAWDPETAAYGAERKRQADVYVFAVLFQPDRQLVDPLDLEHWQFLVVASADLNRHCGKQGKLGLARLRAIPHSEVSFDGLADAVRVIGLRDRRGDGASSEQGRA